MPGPTTEVLNEDIKEVKADIRDIRSDLDVLRADVHQVAIGLAELRAEFRAADIQNVSTGLAELRAEFRAADIQNVSTGLAELRGRVDVMSGIAKWGGALLVTTLLTSGVGGVWWASRIDAQVRLLESRFDRFETLMVKIVEQGRLAPPVPKSEKASGEAVK